MSDGKERNKKRPNDIGANPTRSFDSSNLGPNSQIGQFRIEQELGRGGAGVVYLAHDTKLDRSVAIKSLPSEVKDNPKALSRFTREAKVLASLNHPNIATIYDEIKEADGVDYIILEYIPGQTLAERIAGSKLKLEEALTIALQIAEAVSAAHEHDVIHRDLKPGNIKITPEGKVKVLDFGLAKALGGQVTDQQSTVTEPGRIIGTPAYMSPEQARGNQTDKRCDIWSFGCVLYEMLTGKVPFEGDTVSDTLANILQTEPDWQALPRYTPASICVILHRCLEKDPYRRLRDIGDAAIEIRETLSSLATGPPMTVSSVATSRPRSLQRLIVWAGTFLLFGAIAGSLVTWSLMRPSLLTTQPFLTKLTDQPGPELFPSLSPNGETVIYASRESGNWDIYSLRVGGENPINLTENCPDDDTQPAFSTDGQNIAFRSERDGGGIFVMGATGESPNRITRFGYNPVWSSDSQEILFATEGIIDTPLDRMTISQLWVANIDTGEQRKISDEDAVQPHCSPHGYRIAYWTLVEGGQRDIVTIPYEGGEPVQVTYDPATDWNPVWSSDGNYLYFCSDWGGSMDLWRIKIDEPTGQVLGKRERVTSNVSADIQHPSVSLNAPRIAYVSQVRTENIQKIAFDAVAGEVKGEPIWVTRGSSRIGIPCPSPDGKRLTYNSAGRQEDIFIIKTDGSNREQRTNDHYKDRQPQWSPDGSDRIAFFSDRSGSYEAWTINDDGSELKPLTDTPGRFIMKPLWSPDASRLAYNDQPDLPGVASNVAIIDPCIPYEEQTPEVLPDFGDPEESFFMESWSPNGEMLAGIVVAVNTGVYGGIVIYSFESQEFVRLKDFGMSPVFLRDSRRLLFVHEDKLYLLDDIKTKQHSELLSIKPDIFAHNGNIAIQADNSWIYFTRETTEADIWMME